MAGRLLRVPSCWLTLVENGEDEVIALWRQGGKPGSFPLKCGDHVCSVPVLLAGHTAGFLHVDAGPAGLTPSQRATLTEFAGLAADILAGDTALVRRTQAAARAPRTLGQIELLHQLSRCTHANLGELFAGVIHTGCAMFDLEDGLVAELGDSAWLIRAARGTDLDITPGSRLAIGHRLFDPTLHVGQTSVTRGGDGRFVAAAPISPRGVFYGALVFCSERPGVPAFSPQDRKMLELLAGFTATAVREQRLGAQVAYMSGRDSLTGLLNRRAFEQYLAGSISAPPPALGVLVIDLDRFKHINSTLGHDAGDEALREAAFRLSRPPGSGTVARLGGDEFVACVESGSREDCLKAASRMLGALRSPFRVLGHEFFLTASIGVALYPDDGTDAGSLMSAAADAMHRMKLRGRNGVECRRPHENEQHAETLRIENALRRALAHQEFEVYYQPQLDFEGQLRGFEVLLSWRHPEMGRISPTRFIPIAEDAGMIVAIGTWVLRQACRHGREWQLAGRRPPRIAVNVSALQFAQADFVEVVAHILEETGLDPRLLELELTESVILRDLEEAALCMARLRALGVSISIDDFGTGYSSLNYLRRLPVDTLKIDRSFLSGLAEPGGTLPLIQTVVALAHTWGIRVIAEGVETREQFELLRQSGCDLMQGHLFGRACGRAEAEEMLEGGRAERSAQAGS